jgi:hypothetical protein
MTVDMNPSDMPYYGFTSKARVDKAMNSLLGIIEGIAADGATNEQEAVFLGRWLAEQAEVRDRHPFSELVPVIEDALSDGVLTGEEQQDILWLFERLRSKGYYDAATASMQRLHAFVGGILADQAIDADELKELAEWLEDHATLRTCWPYDEIDSIATRALSQGRMDEEGLRALTGIVGEFRGQGAVCAPASVDEPLSGLCAVCPVITFPESVFCFTGASAKHSRSELSEMVVSRGGKVTNGVTKALNYLVIGSAANPCWAYACYGRKVEKAVMMRKQGHRILLVHENDFRDACAASSGA